MKKMKHIEIVTLAKAAYNNYVCSCGLDNAEKIIRLTLEKIVAKRKILDKTKP